MEQQLVAECEKLIFTIRQVCSIWNRPDDLAGAVNEARICADEVEDFIVNNCGE